MALNAQQKINESTFGLPIVISLLMHIAIVYAITINIDWSEDESLIPDPVQAFVVSDFKEIKKNKPLPVVDPELEAIKMRDAAVERIRQERLAEEEQERIQLEKEKAIEERLAKAEAERLEKEKKEQARLEKERLAQEKLEEERMLQEAIDAEAAKLEQIRQDELNSEVNAEQNRVAQLNAQYKYAIRDKISRNWNKPINIQDSYQCDVSVKQIPGGDIVDISVTRCVGDAIFRTSVENALQKVKVLPYTGFEEVFTRDIEFTFKP